MKLTKKLMFLFTTAMILSVFQLSAQEKKRVAKDDAVIQTNDKTRATRKVPENGTKIIMRFGSTEIPGVLNDSNCTGTYKEPALHSAHDSLQP